MKIYIFILSSNTTNVTHRKMNSQKLDRVNHLTGAWPGVGKIFISSRYVAMMIFVKF